MASVSGAVFEKVSTTWEVVFPIVSRSRHATWSPTTMSETSLYEPSAISIWCPAVWHPLTSIMAMTTALDWYLMVGSHTLKRRSSDLISWNLASPLAALRFMFSMMVRFLSRFVMGPFLRTSVKRTASVCSSCWRFCSRLGSPRSSKIIAASSSMEISAS